MLHRAILGSLERWIGIIIEQYSGRMPPWLAPVQVVVASITDSANDYAAQVTESFRAAGMRAESDLRNEKISYKVREHSVMKVPYILAVGGREEEAGTVALRRLGSNEQQVIPMDEALAMLRGESLPPTLREGVRRRPPPHNPPLCKTYKTRQILRLISIPRGGRQPLSLQRICCLGKALRMTGGLNAPSTSGRSGRPTYQRRDRGAEGAASTLTVTSRYRHQRRDREGRRFRPRSCRSAAEPDRRSASRSRQIQI